MPKKARKQKIHRLPTSINLTTDEKNLLKKMAAQEKRTMGGQIRHIVEQYCTFHLGNKGDLRGEEGKEGG